MHMPAPSLRLILVFLLTGSLGTLAIADHEPVSLDWQSQKGSSTLNSDGLCTGYYLTYQACPSEQKLNTDPQPLYTDAETVKKRSSGTFLVPPSPGMLLLSLPSKSWFLL